MKGPFYKFKNNDDNNVNRNLTFALELFQIKNSNKAFKNSSQQIKKETNYNWNIKTLQHALNISLLKSRAQEIGQLFKKYSAGVKN